MNDKPTCPRCGSNEIEHQFRGIIKGPDTNRSWCRAVGCGWSGILQDCLPEQPEAPGIPADATFRLEVETQIEVEVGCKVPAFGQEPALSNWTPISDAQMKTGPGIILRTQDLLESADELIRRRNDPA